MRPFTKMGEKRLITNRQGSTVRRSQWEILVEPLLYVSYGLITELDGVPSLHSHLFPPSPLTHFFSPSHSLIRNRQGSTVQRSQISPVGNLCRTSVVCELCMASAPSSMEFPPSPLTHFFPPPHSLIRNRQGSTVQRSQISPVGNLCRTSVVCELWPQHRARWSSLPPLTLVPSLTTHTLLLSPSLPHKKSTGIDCTEKSNLTGGKSV